MRRVMSILLALLGPAVLFSQQPPTLDQVATDVANLKKDLESLKAPYVRVIATPDGNTAASFKGVDGQWKLLPTAEMPVAAPTKQLYQSTQNHQYQISNHAWRYPYVKPFPGGTFEVRSAPVDKNLRVGAWSQPKRLVTKSGWHLFVRSDSQPCHSDIIATVFRLDCIDVPSPAYGVATGVSLVVTPEYSTENGSPLPYFGDVPYFRRCLHSPPDGFWRLDRLPMGGRRTEVAPPPVCYASNIPCAEHEIAWCRVSEKGETALSPAFKFTVPTPASNEFGQWDMAEVCHYTYWMNEPHPQGTLGLHLYIRLPGQDWKRLPAPQCAKDTPDQPDDWLWPMCNFAGMITRMVDNAPTHQPVESPRSTLTGLHRAYAETGGDIVVEVPEIKISCPLIDEYGWMPTGSNGFPYKLARRVTGLQGMTWRVVQAIPGGQESYWPILMVYNQYSKYQGMQLRGNAYAALAYSDYSGGQAFGNEWSSCTFDAGNHPAGITHGVIVDYSQAAAGHTASEQSFTDCHIGGNIGIYCAGNQSANWRFNRTHLNGGLAERRHSPLFVSHGNLIRFTGGLYIGNSTGLLYNDAGGCYVMIDDLWADQGFHWLVRADFASGTDVTLNGGKLNCWVMNDGVAPNLLVTLYPRDNAKLTINNVVPQFSSIYRLDCVSTRHRQLDVRFTDTALLDFAFLMEPTWDQQSDQYKAIWGPGWTGTPPPEKGIKLTTPAETITVPESSVVIPSQTIRQKINGSRSFTTIVIPQQTVTVPSWTFTKPEKLEYVNSLQGRRYAQRDAVLK